MRRHAQVEALGLKWKERDETGGLLVGIELDGPDGKTPKLAVIASWGMGWDHVSVSLVPVIYTEIKHRIPPDWNAMEAVRRAFFYDTETVVQIHPPLAQYVNTHPGVLHLWRAHSGEHPVPPRLLVG